MTISDDVYHYSLFIYLLFYMQCIKATAVYLMAKNHFPFPTLCTKSWWTECSKLYHIRQYNDRYNKSETVCQLFVLWVYNMEPCTLHINTLFYT